MSANLMDGGLLILWFLSGINMHDGPSSSLPGQIPNPTYMFFSGTKHNHMHDGLL